MADEKKDRVGKEARNLRWEKVRQMLSGGARISEAAHAANFLSLSAFCSFVRKHAGVAPAEIQQRVCGNVSDRYCEYPTQIGTLCISADGKSITSVGFTAPEFASKRESDTLSDNAAEQIREYLSGKRKSFDLPLSPYGTPFQLSVWEQLKNIPYGETRSYLDIAEAVGNKMAVRAVGGANNKNPLMILIPCHRVVGKDGTLVGYAGGLEVKRKLLELEREHSANR